MMMRMPISNDNFDRFVTFTVIRTNDNVDRKRRIEKFVIFNATMKNFFLFRITCSLQVYILKFVEIMTLTSFVEHVYFSKFSMPPSTDFLT